MFFTTLWMASQLSFSWVLFINTIPSGVFIINVLTVDNLSVTCCLPCSPVVPSVFFLFTPCSLLYMCLVYWLSSCLLERTWCCEVVDLAIYRHSLYHHQPQGSLFLDIVGENWNGCRLGIKQYYGMWIHKWKSEGERMKRDLHGPRRPCSTRNGTGDRKRERKTNSRYNESGGDCHGL